MAVALVALFLAIPALVQGALCPTPPTNICRVSPPDRQGQHPHCGSRGQVKPARTKGNIIRGPCTASYEACRNACLAKPKCTSFLSNEANRDCVLYSARVEALGFDFDGASPQRFYNRNCFTFSFCTPTTTTTTTEPTETCLFKFRLKIKSDQAGTLVGSYLSVVSGSPVVSDNPADASLFGLDSQRRLTNAGLTGGTGTVTGPNADRVIFRADVGDAADGLVCSKTLEFIDFHCKARQYKEDSWTACPRNEGLTLYAYDSRNDDGLGPYDSGGQCNPLTLAAAHPVPAAKAKLH